MTTDLRNGTTQTLSSPVDEMLKASLLRLDARAPLFVLTLSDGDPNVPDELALDHCYVVFNDMQHARDWAYKHQEHPINGAPLPWRITVLAPTENFAQGPGNYDGLFKRLFGICMVHAVLSDPRFKKYYTAPVTSDMAHNHAHTWPIVVSLTHMADLCQEAALEAAEALQVRDVLGQGDYNTIQPACLAISRMFSDYWRRIRRMKSSLTACQRASNLITTLLTEPETTKEESKNA